MNRPCEPGEMCEKKAGRIAALGVFDGVHLGHRRILEEALRWAREDGVTALAMTFSTHPDSVIQRTTPNLIVSMGRRVRILESLGFDAVLLLPFNEKISRISAEKFARNFLARGLGLTGIVVGPDFRFGHRATGDVELLREIGKAHGFGVHVLEPVLHENEVISSSRIRKLVESGDMEAARSMLGRPFHLRGQVVLGQRRGRTIGFPTANLAPEALLRPAIGVYATTLDRSNGQVLPAVTNVGVCPTFGGAAPLTVETHVLDFEEDFYGEEVGVAFHKRLRGEMKFSSPVDLARQIRLDISRAEELFSSNPSLTDTAGTL